MNRSTSAAIVQARHLGKQVASPSGPLTILDDISLDIEAGEQVAVLGASGSGKSTLLGLLAGLDTPSSGEVFLHGRSLGAMSEDGRAALRAGRVGFVFQNFHLLGGLTALENVMLPLELADDDDPRGRAEAVLQQVGLGARIAHYPNQLSGGEQQRVALARAFASQPSVLFADEPTGNLDQRTGAQVIDLLFSLNAKHRTTLILVTHDTALAQRCGRRLQLEGGRMLNTVAP